MSTKGPALVVLGALATAAVASAQSDLHACEPSPELASLYRQVKASHERVRMLEDWLAADPVNLFLNRWYLESPQIRIGSHSDEYRKKLEQHPDDPQYLYLYGRALMGADTPKAIDSFNRAIAKDPDLLWTYWSLMEVYTSPNFKNPAKLAEDMLTFTRLCPADPDGFQYLSSVEDKATVRELAARFRKAVEGRNTSDAAAHYPALWAAEFRATNPEDFDRVRKQVSDDLKRVKTLDPNNTRALIQGYKLIGDAEAAKALERKSAGSNSKDFLDVTEAWNKEHPYPKRDAAKEDWDRFYRADLKAAEQWVKDWPGEDNAWYWRFLWLARLKSTPDREVEKAGDDLMAVVADEPGVWSPVPYAIDVAREWLKRDIRVKDCLRLGEQAIAELDRGPGSDNDMRRGSQDEQWKRVSSLVATSRFEALNVQAEAWRKLKEFEKTRSVMAEMKGGLDSNRSDHPYLEFMYLVQTARLAEAEGHKLDALAYYQQAIGRWDHDPAVTERRRAIWNELGGSEEGFQVWSTRPEAPKAQPARPVAATAASGQSARPQVATELRPWAKMNKPLTSMTAADLTGRTWTAADLKGKTTLISVWATWCGPCLAELPYLQQLYDQLNKRQDIQVISINMDENPGLVGPFMQDKRYTFPVLLAKPLVDELMPTFSIPRNWIADANANLRLESIGFGDRSENWPRQMIEKLSQPLQ